MNFSRSSVLYHGSYMRTFIAALLSLSIFTSPVSAADPSYREAAIETARWIRASAIKTHSGTVWPADPRDAKSINDTLYAGTPGIVLFFLEAYHLTGDHSF